MNSGAQNASSRDSSAALFRLLVEWLWHHTMLGDMLLTKTSVPLRSRYFLVLRGIGSTSSMQAQWFLLLLLLLYRSHMQQCACSCIA